MIRRLRRVTIVNVLELRVVELRRNRADDGLERARTPEVGVRVRVSHQTLEIDQTAARSLEIGREVGEHLFHLEEAPFLEVVIHEDRSLMPERGKQRLGGGTHRGVVAEVEMLTMTEPTRRVLDVAGPLEDDLLVRPRATPHGNRALRCLEIEVVARIRQRRQELARGGVHGAETGIARRRGPHRSRAALNRASARATLTVVDERAVIWLVALRPDCTRRAGSRQDVVELAHPDGHACHERAYLIGDGNLSQQPAVVAAAGVDEGGVDDGHLEHVQVQTGALRRPRLDRDVLQVMLLEPGRRLHLDELGRPVATPEDVAAYENAAMAKSRLEERDVSRLGQRELGVAQGSAEIGAPVDEVAGAVEYASETADIVARAEAPLRCGIIGDELRAVHLQPQASAALKARGDS